MKYLFVFLLLLYVSFIKIDACQSPILTSNSFILQCSESSFGLKGSFAVLHSYKNKGYSFSFSPEVKDFNIGYKGTYYSLTPGLNYTVTWQHETDPTCNNVTYVYVPQSTFEISQPKCRYSQGSVKFIPDNNMNSPYISASCQDAPCNFTRFQDASYLYSDTSRNLYCFYGTPYYELSDKYPNLKVQDSYYYNSSGSIQLFDLSKYTFVNLTKNGNSSFLIPDSPVNSGNWINLDGRESYNLYLESSDCGVQNIPIYISQRWPDYYFEFGKNESCPRNFTIKMVNEDPNIYEQVEVIVDGQRVIQKDQLVFRADPTSNSIETNFVLIGDSNVGANLNTYAPNILGDVHYSVDPYTRLVTLYYNDTLINDLYAMNGEYNIEIVNKTFNLPEGSVFIESPCHFAKIYITLPPPTLPSFTITKPQEYCGDTFDVYVANYMDFEQLTIGPEEYEHDGYGYFRNINPSEGFINYLSNGYDEVLSVNFELTQYKPGEYEEIIDIISYPACSKSGNVSYTLRDIKRNILSQTTYFTFYPLGSIYLITSFHGCNQDIGTTWISPNIENNKNNFPKEFYPIVLKNTTCKYSNDGSLLFPTNPTIQINPIKVNGITYQGTSTLAGFVFENLPYGTNDYILESSMCQFVEAIFIGTDNDWELPVTVTPVTGDCTVANGGISYNSSIFSDFSVANAQNINQLASDYYHLDFTLTNGTCFGSTKVYVTSNVQQYYPSGKILTQPSCDSVMDGVVQLFVNDKNGKSFTPTRSTYNLQSDIFSVYTVQSGQSDFVIYKDVCSWKLGLSIVSRDPEFIYSHISDNLESCSQQTIYSIVPKDKNITINDVTSDQSLEKFSNNLFAYPSTSFGLSKHFMIRYNSYCLKTIIVDAVKDLRINIPWPTINIPSTDCTDPSVQNKVAQISNPSNMTLCANEETYSLKNLYVPTYHTDSAYFFAQDRKTSCFKNVYYNSANIGKVPNTVTKPTCPGGDDGGIQPSFNPDSLYQLFDNEYNILPIGSNSNTYKNISNTQYNLIRSFLNNPFCSVVENIKVEVDEPTVSLSSVGVCDASNTAIGDVGVVTNTLSITTTNVTYNLNGHVSTNPVFKGLSAGDYSSTVTIYNSVCKRTIKSNSVSVAKLPSVSVNVDVSTCMKAVINPSNTNIQFKYTIRDSTDKVVYEITSTGSFTYTPISIDTYSVTASDMSKTCSKKTSFTVTECPTQPPTNAPTGSSSSTEPMPSSSFKLIPSIISLISFAVVFYFI
ncbi:hypothetical protein CYY_008422 [Polysphondylium violaceum]|uniref:Uncharacterized protein n=1 Tax=Polysphondylium violaceum TaxID=133409 RepID=A0A8J4V196_9MYCE|nr:hypothetical protein CYY_008422 [Polysphondylium violaceum]